MNKILVITSLPDPHVDMVQAQLQSDMIVFDPRKLIDGLDLSYRFGEDTLEIKFEGLSLNDCDAVWYRKPVYLEPQDFPVEPKCQEFAQKAYKTMVKALYDLLEDSFWLSDYRNIIKGNNKAWQLEKAAELGFRVPKTLISNNPTEVESFRQIVGNVVTKSLTFSPVLKDDKYYGFFTTVIDAQQELDLSGLPIAPAIFQEVISDKVDLRVTVVGNSVFPCFIHPYGSVKSSIDWRVGIKTGELRYEEDRSFSDKMKIMCIDLTRKLGLYYGAIDFALDDQGNYWFLEINPNGQWAFIELESGLPISRSIANLLSSRGGS